MARFDGLVINFMGDGLIAGFASKSTISCDTAFDAATEMVAIMYAAINPELRARQYPPVDIRIAADAGEAHVRTFGSPHSPSQPDVTGIALSMASKIQAVATPGEIWLGRTMYEHLHISRQELCRPADLPESWRFTNDVGHRYHLFEMPMKSRLRSASYPGPGQSRERFRRNQVSRRGLQNPGVAYAGRPVGAAVQVTGASCSAKPASTVLRKLRA